MLGKIVHVSLAIIDAIVIDKGVDLALQNVCITAAFVMAKEAGRGGTRDDVGGPTGVSSIMDPG